MERHETHVELNESTVDLDYRDQETLEIRIHLERFDVVLHVSRAQVREMIEEGFDQL